MTDRAPMTDRRPRRWWPVVIAFVATLAAVTAGVVPRLRARGALRRDTAAMAIPTVNVLRLERSPAVQEVILPANVRGFVEAPIFARTSGYLKRWTSDIGARVKAGALLAEIETPEVDQQLRQARADLAASEASQGLSRITATRFAELLKTDSVARQDADNTAGQLAAQTAAVASARANVRRLQELQSFKNVYAPFDGVITARNTDVGALIDPGSSQTPRAELFHIAQAGKLRVYASVPEAYAPSARVGLAAELTVAQLPGRRFAGTLARTASAIDPVTRTLLVEVSVDNPTGELLPGAFARLHFRLPRPAPVFLVPVGSLMFRSEGLRVAVASPEEGGRGRVRLVPITIGRDLGAAVEVATGLSGSEAVIADPPDSLVDGQEVKVAQAAASPGPKPGAP
jgi:RND family efflux transporter MFP subunit